MCIRDSFYTDMKSYVPAEGFIPTADIAVKIAECVLLEIYGKESIEKEKPFSEMCIRDRRWEGLRRMTDLPRSIIRCLRISMGRIIRRIT